MKLARYELKSGEKLEVFEFVSVGKKGRIYKMVQYSKTNYKGVYNLAFGDKNTMTGELDDMSISNNGDSEKVLATVVATPYAFFDSHPDAYVYATGSTESRTRLYQMGISKYLEEGLNDFEIFGEIESNWEEFKRDTNYLSFLVKLKEK
ncbi:MAG: hypothetical protein AAF849_00900 [Bacteroidota bacterium]